MNRHRLVDDLADVIKELVARGNNPLIGGNAMRNQDGYLYVARVERDTLTGEVTLVPGRDADVFEIHEGDEFITFRCPVALFGEDQ